VYFAPENAFAALKSLAKCPLAAFFALHLHLQGQNPPHKQNVGTL
jgi:hypothetical protein